MRSLISRLGRLALVASFLTGCASATISSCPPWPVGGPVVAAELERLPDAEYPALWAWLGRLAVLHDQLAECRP